MFPFNLSGPWFLLFFALFATLALVIQWHYSNNPSGRGWNSLLNELTSDPYRIAYLRDGEQETVRLAVINLVDRGLVEFKREVLSAADAERASELRRPLDRAILASCARRASPSAVFSDPNVRAECDEYRLELITKGLLPDADEWRARRNAVIGVILIVGGLAAARIFQAVTHGRSNIGFLVVLTGLVCAFAIWIYARRTTVHGRLALANVETLTKRLKRAGRVRKGGATNDALLLAAVFGVYALPEPAFAFVEQMFPKPKPRKSESDADSDSGSWFSFDSGGSSCGGGGSSGCGGCGGGGD